MMHIDPLFLSRLQFAWVISFHILLPAFTIGLASFIAVLEGISYFTQREIYFRISVFWIKIFAVTFSMGIVSGIVMPFQLGTNWSRYSDAISNVLSPLFSYEVLTAFFLEATFLGILLFGRQLVPRWVHFFSAITVAVGTVISAFWILAANSWMQTPVGFKILNGIFYPTDWLSIIFNPSFPYRLAHTVIGFYITTGFVVLGVAAGYLHKGRFIEESRIMLSMTCWLLTFIIPLQILLGDLHGLNTLKYQPAKIAAIEAHWSTEKRAPLTLFALPDEKNEINRYVFDIPLLGSLILTHAIDGEVPGLKQWPANQRAPVMIPFFSFRIMFGIGIIMLSVILLSLWLRIRRRLFVTRWFLILCQIIAPIGFFAVLAGWVTTEVGRQPWTVYGLLRTAQSISPSLTGIDVLLSLLGYMLVYLMIFPAGIALMIRIIRKGPSEVMMEEPIEGGQHNIIHGSSTHDH